MGQKLEMIINQAIMKTNELRHEFLTLETILWALIDDSVVLEVFREFQVNLPDFRLELEQFLLDEKNYSILSEEQIEELGRLQFVNEELRMIAGKNGIRYQPDLSLALQRVIQNAAMGVQAAGKKQILGINLLVAMYQENESFAVYLLQKYGIDRFRLLQFISHGLDQIHLTPSTAPASRESSGPGAIPQKKSILDLYCLNLNEQAVRNRIDPLIGREDEVLRIMQILLRRQKNNPLLVGDAGVGKTAIAEGLAWKIVQKQVPEIMHNTTIFSLDMAALLAGTKYRGDFEERFKNILKELSDAAEKGDKSVLFIDELHIVMGAGATSGSSMDAANLLRPALAAGNIRCMGSTTFEEYRKFIEKDHAFGRRFQKVEINEPSEDETYQILLGVKKKLEEHHGVVYPNNILRPTVLLAIKYLTDRKLPDKAIDILDEVGAAVKVRSKRSGEGRKKIKITLPEIEEIVSVMAKVPKETVAEHEKDQLKDLERNLQLVIFGQDQAIKNVTDAIFLSRAGLRASGRPIGNFLFTGPTGVGKTELAKQLAKYLGLHFQRFDMSEYMEKHAVAKLIGAPPGYVGYESGGVLTDIVKKYPSGVLLLDEVEKAHPDIFNILLQVMDYGALTDSQGRTTNFQNIILIMTSNAGAREMEKGSIGFSKEGNNISKRDHTLKNIFSPEFRNRLDGIINFNKLTEREILRVVDKFLMELELQLALKNVAIEVAGEVRTFIAEKGYDSQLGARPISRLIDQEIRKKLSPEMLFGVLAKAGGTVKIGLNRTKQPPQIECNFFSN